MRPRVLSTRNWHSPSNAHAYRLLVFKELAPCGAADLQSSAKTAILTRFSKTLSRPLCICRVCACLAERRSRLALQSAKTATIALLRGEPRERPRLARRQRAARLRRRDRRLLDRAHARSGSSASSTRSSARAQRLRVGAQDALLDRRDLRRVHREAAQAHRQQQLGERRIAGHLAADADVLAARARACAMVCAISCSTAGCHGSYRCATASSARSIASVYWIRSLVPIETKSKWRRKAGSISAAAGTSIIAPTSTSAKRAPASVSCCLARASASKRVPHLAQVRHHRHQQPHLAVRAGAQDRAQLLAKHRRLRQAPADRAQAERRIERVLVAQLVAPTCGRAACRRRCRRCGSSPAGPCIASTAVR